MLKAVVAAAAGLLLAVGLAGAARAEYLIGYNETKSLFAGVTFVHYDRGHGTQVEYMAKNGSTYLFYPGNERVLKGSWKLDRTDKANVFNLCFKYAGNTYNPVTGHKGGGWECQPAGFALTDVVDSAPGDVMGLAKRQAVPFVLSKRKASLAQLLRKLN